MPRVVGGPRAKGVRPVDRGECHEAIGPPCSGREPEEASNYVLARFSQVDEEVNGSSRGDCGGRETEPARSPSAAGWRLRGRVGPVYPSGMSDPLGIRALEDRLHRPTARLGAVCLVFQALTGCAGAATGRGPAPESSPAPSSTPSSSTAPTASPAPDSSPTPVGEYPYTEADVRFMSAMIGHHAQALVMAGMAPTHGASPAVQRLAERIVAGQQDEIASMQQWLRERGRPVPEGHAGHGTHHGAHMPGMLTEGALRQLDGARGQEFDEDSDSFGAAYEAAWFACRMLARRVGEDALVRFYGEVDDAADFEDEFRHVFGLSVAAFTRSWRHGISRLAG